MGENVDAAGRLVQTEGCIVNVHGDGQVHNCANCVQAPQAGKASYNRNDQRNIVLSGEESDRASLRRDRADQTGSHEWTRPSIPVSKAPINATRWPIGGRNPKIKW